MIIVKIQIFNLFKIMDLILYNEVVKVYNKIMIKHR